MKKIVAVLLLGCLLLPQTAFAGAWTLPESHLWVEYYTKAFWAKEDFGPEGDKRRFVRDARSWGWAMIPKFEYGVFDRLTLLGGITYKEEKYKEYARPPGWGPFSVKNHGVTDVDFGARFRILENPVVLSGQVKASYYMPYDALALEDRAELPEIGKRNDALEFRVLVGKYFNTEIPFYIGAETGYRFKNRNVCNDIPFFIEFGFWPVDWLLIKTEIDGYWSHDGTGVGEEKYAIWRIGPTIHLLTIFNHLTGNDKKFTPSGQITKEENSLDFEVQYGNTFWGRNTVARQELIAKVSSQF